LGAWELVVVLVVVTVTAIAVVNVIPDSV